MVLRAAIDLGVELSVIVATAEFAGARARPPSASAGPSPAVRELQRAFDALAGDEVALARAMRRPLTLDRLGRRPLGNLMIHSLAAGFGDLGRASAWLGAQLGLEGEVLPASVHPLAFTVGPGPAQAGPTAAWVRARDRVQLTPERPEVPSGVTRAIGTADVVLLAPGSLFRATLVAAAIPDIAAALRSTSAQIVWICNMEPEDGETACDQLDVLVGHGLRVDAALYDPDCALGRSCARLAGRGVHTIARPMRAAVPGAHDPAMLRAALSDLVRERQRQHT